MAKRGVEIPITAQDMTRAAFASAAKNARRLDAQLQATAVSGQRVQRSMRGTRGAMGQLGFQIQDIAVQLQSGQNALLVFGQQGSQIASIFGPGGAVAGAILAVSAAIGTALLPKLFDSKTATEELETALAGLDEIVGITDTGVVTLSQSLAKLATMSREAAGVQLEAAVIQAEAALDAAVGRFSDKFDERVGGFLSANVDTAIAEAQRAMAAGLSADRLFQSGRGAIGQLQREYGSAFGALRESAGGLARQLGITNSEAVTLLATVGDVGESGSEEDLDRLLETIIALAPAGSEVSKELRLMVSELLTLTQAADDARERLEGVAGARDQFVATGELPNTEDEQRVIDANTEAYAESLARRLEAETKLAEGSSQQWAQMAQARSTAAQQILSVSTMQAQQMATLAAEGSAAGKAFFVVQQGLAAANAVISGIMASMSITQAYASLAAMNPPAAPMWLAMGQAHATAARVMGVASAGAIMAQTVASFEGGGFTGLGPRSGGVDGKGGFPAILHPNESVIDHTKPMAGDGAQRGGGDLVINVSATDAKSFQDQLTGSRGYIYSLIDQYHRRKGRRV